MYGTIILLMLKESGLLFLSNFFWHASSIEASYEKLSISLTANWCRTRRNSTRAYAHLLHQLMGFSKFVPAHRKSILVLQGIVIAVVDSDEIRDFLFLCD